MGDTVELFYTVPPSSELLRTTMQQQSEYLVSNLGCNVLPETARSRGAVVIASEDQQITLLDGTKIDFTAILAMPTVSVDTAAIAESTGVAALGPAAEIYLASRDLASLKIQAVSGHIVVALDGHQVSLEAGKHFHWSASDRAW